MVTRMFSGPCGHITAKKSAKVNSNVENDCQQHNPTKLHAWMAWAVHTLERNSKAIRYMGSNIFLPFAVAHCSLCFFHSVHAQL